MNKGINPLVPSAQPMTGNERLGEIGKGFRASSAEGFGDFIDRLKEIAGIQQSASLDAIAKGQSYDDFTRALGAQNQP